MPLPAGYMDTYKAYKAGTDNVTTWLVDNARRCGADLSHLPTGPSKYPIPVNEFPRLARRIAVSTDPLIRIPKHIITLVRSVISLRKHVARLCAKFSKQKSAPPQDGHLHIIAVLEDVLAILQPSEADKATEDTVSNMFAALHVEEPASDGTTPSKTAKAVNKPRYEMEESADLEPLLAMFMFVKDVNDIRDYLKGLWTDYRAGELDLMTAAITTDTAFNLMRCAASDLEEMIEDLAYPALRGLLEDDLGGATDAFDEWICSQTYALMEQSSVLLVPGRVRTFKAKHFGIYDLKKDWTKMSTQERQREDLILVMEILPEFIKLSHGNVLVPAEDELTAAIREMADASALEALPLHAVFAMQVFLDIHHILQEDITRPFEQLQTTGERTIRALDKYFHFSRGSRVSIWPVENDEFLHRVRELAHDWTRDDTMAKVARTIYNKPPVNPPFFLFKNHPVLCGTMTYRLNALLQEIGMSLCNAWRTALFPAHLYNAARQNAGLESEWRDIEYVISINSAQHVFVGALPIDSEACFKHFLLAFGVSATNFARNRRRGGPPTIAESEKGPRDLKEKTPVRNIFDPRYVEDETGKLALTTPSLVALLSVASKAERTSRPSIDLQAFTREMVVKRQYTHLQLLQIIREGVAAEELHLLFDYVGLHIRISKLMGQVQTRLHADLVKQDGPDYVQQEWQRIHIIGYILENATRGGSMLQKASEVLDGLLRKEGSRSIDSARALSNAWSTSSENGT